MSVFAHLLDLLFPPRATERLIRAVETDALLPQVTPAVHASRALSLLPYRDALVHAAIIEAKFHMNEKAQHMLGNALAEYLMEEVGTEHALHAYTLVPIPLSARRLRERGYNQAERICTKAAASLDISVSADIIRRVRHTRPQTELDGAARQENMRGAFFARSVTPHTTYLLVDDVITTGATLRAAAKALRDAGATRVLRIALAH